MIALALTFILAACSLIYELTIAQTISLFAVNNVVWYSLIVGIFIGSMGLGAFFSPRLFRGPALWDRLVLIEIFLGIVGGFSALAIQAAHTGSAVWLAQSGIDAWGAFFFAVAFLAAALVGVLSGAELPLLIELAEGLAPGKDRTARVIALDYLGSLAGAVLFALVLVPRMDMCAASWLVALVNLAAAAVLAFRFRASGGENYGAFLTVFAAVFVALLYFAAPIQQYFLKAYYYYAYPKGELQQDVRHYLTPYQTIDIVRLGAERKSLVPDIIAAYSRKYERVPDLPRGFALFLNKDFQFYADVEEIYHETFVHVPIAAAGQVPRRVLIMGGGDGLLLRELVKYPGVQRVVQVEIDPGVVELFRSDRELSALTAGAYADPRLQLVFDDAYHYIRHCQEFFDAIYLDFPAPVDFSLSKLYSREFYVMVRQHLSPDGFVAANAPGLVEDIRQRGSQPVGEKKIWRTLYNTFESAGFGNVLPFFSMLEDDNPKALEILERDYALASDVDKLPEGSTDMLKEDLRDVLDNLTSGFILAQPVAQDVMAQFDGEGLPLDVMNQKRYSISILGRVAFRDEKDPRAVNSILRPRLPDLSGWWRIRTPY